MLGEVMGQRRESPCLGCREITTTRYSGATETLGSSSLHRTVGTADTPVRSRVSWMTQSPENT